MANLSLVFDLLAKDHASSAFKNVGDAAEHAGKKGEGFGSSISNGLKMAGGAIAAAGIVEGFKSFYDAAAESAKIGALTQAAITSTGGAAKVTADQVGDLATAISNKTGVDDEAIQSGANLLLTFTNVKNEAGKGNDIFNQTTSIMTDMAAVLGTDASGSAIQLGKALNDPVKGVTALTKVGVSFTDQQKDQIKTLVQSGDTLGAQKVILAELSKEFGGAAAAASTPLDKLKVNLGNLQETIGGNLIPVVARFSDFAVTTLIPAFSKVGDVAGQAFNILFHGDFKGGPLSEDSGIVDKLFNLRDGFLKFYDAVKTFTASDTFATWVRVAKDGADKLWSGLQVLAGFLTGTVIPGFETAGKAIGATAEFFTKHETAAKTLGVVVGAVAGTVVAAWIAQAAVAVTSSAGSVAAWFATATASTTSSTLQSRSTAQIVVGWIASAAAAVANAAVVVGGWVLMGVQSTLQAARMAAAWFIALGPIGWVTAAIIGIAALVIANWDKVSSFTTKAWDAVSAKVTAVASAIWLWVPDKFGALRDSVVGIFTTIRDTVGRVWDGLLDKVKAPIRVVFDFVNGKMIGPINSLLGHFPGGLHIPSLPGFAAGGYTGDGDKHEPKGVVHGGEYVFTKEETAKAGPANLAALAKSLRGYDVGGFVGGIGSAIGGAVGSAVDWGKDILAKGAHAVAGAVLNPLADAAKRLVGDDVIGGMLKGTIDKLVSAVVGKSDEADSAARASSAGPAAGAPGGSVERWRPVVLQALAMLGQPSSLANGVLSLIKSESGGNPNAINLWDSNAKAGHPSRGLMQTIPTTFAANRSPALPNNIVDPLANIYAGIHYALQRYGPGMLAAGGRHAGGSYVGYEKGTNYVPNDGPAYLHKGEAVVPAAENARRSRGGVNGMVFNAPVTITDTDAMSARAFQHAAMADSRWS